MKVIAVSTSEKTGEKKINRDQVKLIENFGIQGDAHAKNWHRQVSLLGIEDIELMRARGAVVNPGDFAENITTSGGLLWTFPVGTRFRAGESTILELTQIGKECHSGCAIMKLSGSCIMPTRGIFCKVIKGGLLRPGDELNPL